MPGWVTNAGRGQVAQGWWPGTDPPQAQPPGTLIGVGSQQRSREGDWGEDAPQCPRPPCEGPVGRKCAVHGWACKYTPSPGSR